MGRILKQVQLSLSSKEQAAIKARYDERRQLCVQYSQDPESRADVLERLHVLNEQSNLVATEHRLIDDVCYMPQGVVEDDCGLPAKWH